MAIDNSEQFVLLNELAEEFAARFRRGERPPLKEYIDRYPELADEIRDVFPAMVEMERVKAAREKVPAPTATGPLPPLERLGDYRILREIGHGGMGVVYEAEQVSLGRRVALKVLLKHRLVDARTKQRFEREAKAAARLHHTNIVPVFGVGEHDGLLYYAMQFIRGLGLDEVLLELKRLQLGVTTNDTASRLLGEKAHGTPREVTAADVARSLMTGRLAAAESASSSGVRVDATVSHAPGAAADAPASTPADGRLSDTFSPASSSAVLPGATPQPGEKQLTYWQSVARIGAQVAAGLDHAHKQGILHRDIKPSNLLLDTHGTVWITDFGLAKEADDRQNLTDSGDVLGTLRYIPPEAFDGKADARGDVYSLGLTLYELLALQPAFGDRDRSRLVKQVTTTEPPRVDRLNRGVPRDLATIVHKAIAREPARRYQTAAELAADLQRFVDDQPILARRMSSAERAWRLCRRNPMVASLAAAVVLTLVLGTAVSTYFAVDATLARDRADANAQEAMEHARREAEARTKAIHEKDRADREAAAAWANLYAVRLNSVQDALENGNVNLGRELLEQVRRPAADKASPPGWEWQHYWRLCNGELRIIRGHGDEINCIAVSPDGSRLVTGSDDRTLRVWDAASGAQLHSLPGNMGRVECLAFSPDGSRLAIGGSNGGVRVFDAMHWQELRLLNGHKRQVRELAFSPDGSCLVSVSDDGTLKLWDVTAGTQRRTLDGHAGQVLCAAYSPDGQSFAAGRSTGTLQVWDHSGRLLQTLQGHNGPVYSVAFSPDGKHLASGGRDWAVKVWDMTGPQATMVRMLTGHTGAVRSVVFSPDGTRVASAGADRVVKLWDALGDREIGTYRGHKQTIYGLAFSPDGCWLASAGADATIRLWETGARSGPRVYTGHDDQVRNVAFSPDGRLLASVGLDGRLNVRDTVTGQRQLVIGEPGPGLLNLAFSPDGLRLATAGDAGMVAVWDAASGRRTWGVLGHADWVNSVAFSPDGQTVASGGRDRAIKLWDAATGHELRTLTGHSNEIWGLAFTPNGQRLISASGDRTIGVWNPSTGDRVQTLKGHAASVSAVAISRDGRTIASASHNHTVKLWELDTGRELATLNGHNNTVWSVAFSPDGTRLASAAWDQTVRIWDVASGHELASLKGHTDRVLGVAFSPDGGRLASAGGKDRTVRVWDGRPLMDETNVEREAVSVLDFLYQRPLPRADILDYLRSSPTVRAPVRALAMTLAERYREETDPAKYHAAVWAVTHQRSANIFLRQFALAQAKAACERAPDHPEYRIALGAAQCRLGHFQKERYTEALATLTECDQGQPLTLVFLAMAQHQLGQATQAHGTLERLRKAPKHQPWTTDTASLLREVAALIEGTKVTPKD